MENYASGGWTQNQPTDYSQQPVYKIGIYGWRKRCLYIFLLLLTVMVVINIALTLWLVRVMDFSTDGIGKLRITKDGLRMEGDAHFLHTLFSKHISSPKHKRLVISSDLNLTLNARNGVGQVVSSMFIGNHKFETLANQLRVKNRRGRTLFFAADDRIEVAAEILKVTGTGGAEFKGAIQTAQIMADYRSSLTLDSPTRTVKLNSPQGISMESRAGDIHAACMRNLKFESKTDAIKIIGNEVYIHSLPIVDVSENTTSAKEVYQLCSCESGELFLAPSTSYCYYNASICQKK